MRKKQKVRSNIFPLTIGNIGVAMSYTVIGNLTYALTDSYAMSTTIVGIIFAASRLFDGFTDLIAGIIIDKTNSKFGKARPFDLFAIPIWIFAIMCFNVPNFSNLGKIIYVFLTYNLCTSVSYTFVTVAQNVRMRHSIVEDKRAKYLSISSCVSAIVAVIVGIIMPIMIKRFENEPHGWFIIVGSLAIPGIIMSLLQFFMAPELEELSKEEDHVEKINIKDAFKTVISNKYLLLFIVPVIVLSFVSQAQSSIAIFYFKYIYGDISIQSVMNMVSIVGYIAILILPLLAKKLGNRNTMFVALIMIGSASFCKYFFKTNFIGLTVCNIIYGIGMVFGMTVRGLLLMDCMEYGQIKSKNNYEGVYSSAQGFADKVALGIASLLVGIVLSIGNFDSTSAVQSASAQAAIQFAYNALPTIACIIAIIALAFYNLEKKLPELRKAKENEQNA